MKKYRKIIINLFDVTAGHGGTYTSNGYVVNGINNTLATSGNDFTPERAIFYSRNFMRNYVGKLVHGQFAKKETFPQHNGGVVNIRGMSPYPTVTTPLTEGVTPAGNLMNFHYVEIVVNQYGAFTPVTDWARFASRDDIIVHDSEELASQAGRTIEEIDVAVLNSGTSVLYAPAVAANGTETAVTTRAGVSALSKFRVKDIFRALNYLEKQLAEPFDDCYVAIVHPDVKFDIMQDKNFWEVSTYADSSRIFKGEIGTIGKIRFVMSPYAKVFTGAGANGIDVYSTLVLGKEAYEIVEIEGQGMQTIIKPLGSAGAGDPINQRATQGWKTTHGIGIIRQTSMVRVESASSITAA